MRLRLGLVGLSDDWNQRHLPALRLLQERFEVCGIYNTVASFADRAASEFGARRFDSFRNLIGSDEVDAVLVLEESWFGLAPIEAACEFGKAVYCGTEIEIAPSEAQGLKDQVERAGVAFVAEFPRRLAPASLRLKELIATRLGAPEIMFCHMRLPPQSKNNKKAKTLQESIDRELMELIDWCRFIAGQPVRHVQGICHHSKQHQDLDYAALSLDLSPEDSGPGTTVAQISCGSYIPPSWQEAINFRPPAAIQVRCEHGLAFLDLPNTLIWFDEAGRHQEFLEAEMTVGQQLLTQFHRAVTSLVRKMSDIEDVCYSLRALQIAQQSIQEGRTLHV